VHRHAVDILAGSDGLERSSLVNLGGNRMLHKDPVYVWVLRQTGDSRNNLCCGRRHGQADVPGLDSGRPASVLLHL
jgi:hypothetical protein